MATPTIEEHLRDIVRLSLGSAPEDMLAKALETCIQLSGAAGGSLLAEEGPYLQFIFADVPDLIGVRVPFDSIAGTSVRRNIVVYTYAPQDRRHFTGIDEQISSTTKYLLSIPIPSVHFGPESEQHTNSAGALQLLFDRDIFPEISVEKGPKEFDLAAFREEDLYRTQLAKVFWTLPLVSFGMEVVKLRRTSHQAIHELKNKLISGLSWVGCLKEDMLARDAELLEDKNIAQDLELSESSIREGAALAKAYLQMATLYAPEFTEVDFNGVLNETAASANAIASEMGVSAFSVDLQLDDGLPQHTADAGQLKMVFLNLCKNAIEALAEHECKEPSLTISSGLRDDRIEIVISDNGPGMPPEIADHLFEAFKTKKEGGTGLGLTIAKKIIDIHGGTISCHTGEGGTAFTIVI